MQLKISEFKKNDNEITIICDKNEEKIISVLKNIKSNIEKKEKIKLNILEEKLKIGDFIVSDRVAIERKTTDDFFKSIIDNRLFEQCENLKGYEIPIILIEGERYEDEKIKKIINGAITSIILNYKIPILFTSDEYETANFLIQLAKKEQISEKRPLRLIEERKALTLEEEKLRVLQSFPQIGPKLAKKLLDHFKSLKNIFHAEQKQLEKIIGKKNAERMKKLIESEN